MGRWCVVLTENGPGLREHEVVVQAENSSHAVETAKRQEAERLSREEFRGVAFLGFAPCWELAHYDDEEQMQANLMEFERTVGP